MNDDTEQYMRSSRLIDKLRIDEEEAIVTDHVLAELVWVLQSCYKASKIEIIAALKVISSSLQVKIASPLKFYEALNAYIVGKGDFADYLLREQAREAGCRAGAT